MREQDSWLDAGSQAIDSTPTWQQAGQDALAQDASGQTWQDAGANAANGWLGAGQDALDGGGMLGAYISGGVPFDPTQWGGNATAGSPGTAQTFNPSAWGSAGAGGISGGGSVAGSGAVPSPSPINNPAGGGGGGGGSGSGSPQQQFRPGYTAAGTGGSSNSGMLSAILGLGSQFFNRQQPQTGAPDLGLNIPGLNMPQGSLQGSQDSGFSFGGLVSGNRGVQQTSQQPQSFNQAAQQSMQSFTGAQKGESGSPFQGGVGSGSSRAGSSGSGFAGSPPTPMQALSQGQMRQPNMQLNAAPSMNGINPAIMGLTGNGLGGSQSPDIAPGMAPIAQLGSAAGEAVGGSKEGSTGNTPGQVGAAPQQQATGIPGGLKVSAVVDPDYNTPIQVKQIPKAPSNGSVVDPDYNTPIQIGTPQDVGRVAMAPPDGSTDAARAGTAFPGPNEYQGFSVQRDLVEPTGDWLKKYMAPAVGVALDKSLSNIAEGVSYPFRTDTQRAETERQLQADELKLARDTKDHPYVVGAIKTITEFAPYMASRIGGLIKGGSKLASVANNALFGGAYGATQYAPNLVDRAVNTGVGILFGGASAGIVPAASSALKVIPKLLNSSAIGAGLGAVSGYSATKNSDLGTQVAATVGGAISGAAGLKYAVKGLKGKVAKGLAEKTTAKAADLSDDALRVARDKQLWEQANPSWKYLPEAEKAKFKNIKAYQAFLQEKNDVLAAAGQAPPKQYGQAHPNAVKWILDNPDKADPTIYANTLNLVNKGYIPDPRVTAKGVAAPRASSSVMSKVGLVADAGFKAASPVATQTAIDARTPQLAQPPSGNVNGPPAAPKEFTEAHNTAIMKKLEKSPDAPVAQAVDPQVLQQVQANAEKDPMVKSLHDQIMIMNPTAMANWADSPEGRTNIYQIVKAKGTPADLEALQKMFQARDEAYAVDPRLKKYSGVDYSGGTPGTPLGAVMDRLSRAEQAKAAKEASKEAESASKAEIRAAVTQKQVSKATTLEETTIERMAREARESRARRFSGRGGASAPVQTRKQKSAFSARLLQLLLSYMMKQPGVQASLNAPGEVGAGSRLLLNQIQTKAYGG